MQLDIKFKSIAGRWFFNIFLIVAIIVCTAVISFSVTYSSIYTERIKSLANDLTYEFNSLSNSSKTAFKENAVELAGSFAYKNKLEVQVIDRNDNIVVSTTGFQPTEQRMPDYEKAIKTGETETAKIKSASGEKVLASTTVIYDATGRRLGAYRWITSLENADKMISWVILILVAVALLVLAFCAFSGLFFINSIVSDTSAEADKGSAGSSKSSEDTEVSATLDAKAFDKLVNDGPKADDDAIAASTWATAVKDAGVFKIGGVQTSTLFSLLNEKDGQTRGFDAGIAQLLSNYILGENKVEITQVTHSLVGCTNMLYHLLRSCIAVAALQAVDNGKMLFVGTFSALCKIR